MNQRFLTTFSIVVIKHIQKDQSFVLGNQSFIRSEIFLTQNISAKQFENSLFYVQVQGNNREFNLPIQFQQRIMFRHKLSNKYLSFSQQFEQQQNDTTYRLQLSQKKCFFKIYPCFQYQTKISSKIKFNEDVYITSQINTAKLGYISTREMDYNSGNNNNNSNNNSLKQMRNTKRTVLGLNYKSKFILHNYYQLQKQQTNYTFGSIIWLTHIQCSSFLNVAQQQQSVLGLANGQINNNYQLQQQQNSNSTSTKYEIMFENIQVDKDMQAIQGLWLIQSDNYQTGGKLHFEQKFMLKNLFSGAYLSFSKNYKLVDNQRIYHFTLQENPSQQSKFVFKSLKGQQNKIKKGSYLILRNSETGAFVGCRKKRIKEASKLTKPTIYFDFSDQDLFKIIQLSQQQSQAIRFIFGVREQLKYISRVLSSTSSNKTTRLQQQQIFSLYDNMKRELIKLSKLDKLYEQVQLQLIKYIDDFTSNIRQFRKKDSSSLEIEKSNNSNVNIQSSSSSSSTIIRNTLKTLYQLLKMICHQNRLNQMIFYRYVHYFIDDFFFNVGAQELVTAIFQNNYSLLCRVPDQLAQLNNTNIVKTIIKQLIYPIPIQVTSINYQFYRYIIKYSNGVKNQHYWLNIEKILKLLMTCIYLNKSTIDINQRLISQQLFQNKTFDKIFFPIKITGQRIKVEVSKEERKQYGVGNNNVNNGNNNSSNIALQKQQSSSSSSSKPYILDIEQVKDPLILKIIEGIFELFWSLCSNRNFISKKAINKYLNQQNKQGPSILINYLNIPISKKLQNNLYGLITNLYIDSCPRINRHKPLSVINFVFNTSSEHSKSDLQQAEITSRLRDQLLLKAEESYRSRPLFISNLLSLTQNFEPTLTPDELDGYKDEINSKITSNRWSVQLLQSMTILMSLQSYTVNEIIQIFDLMSIKLMHTYDTQTNQRNIPTDITIGIMNIYQQIMGYNLELEMKKMTTYLKYKFKKKQYEIGINEIDYLLPQSKKIHKLFDGNKNGNNKNGDQQQENPYHHVDKVNPSNMNNLSPTLEQYNNMQDILLRLYPNTELKQLLYELFVSVVPIANGMKNQQNNKNTHVVDPSMANLFGQNPVLQALAQSDLLSQGKNAEYLKSIHKIFVKFNRPKYYFLKLLMDSIVITKDEAQTFQTLFQKYKTLKHLISISQYWLCNTQNNDNDDTQKFFISMDQITSYFYDDYSFDNKIQFKRDYSSINVNRQLLIRNLGVHIIIFQLLQTNFYLLQKKKRKQISKKHLTTFEKCFQFLNHFIYQCKESKQIVHNYWHVLNKFRDLIEVGQTAVYIELFKNHKDYTKQIKPILVEKIINKICKISTDPKTNAMINDKPSYSLSASTQQCEYNPQFLRFLETICVVNDKCYRPNLQKLYKFMEKQNVFKKIFFAEQDKLTKKFTLCLDMFKIKSDPVQVPFIYHARILKLMNLFISQLDSISTSLKQRIQQMFSMQYLFQIMSQNDIYSHSGIKPQLNFLVKRQITKLCIFYLDKNDNFTKLYQSQKLTKLLHFINKTFLQKPQRKEIESENEKVFFSYLQKYRFDIEYYRTNQRAYYAQYTRPFLIKLKNIFEKLHNHQGNKNYKLITYLVETIKPQKLSHNSESRKDKYNIDSVNIKWRNFVDKDVDNSQEQKFAKKAVLQLLRNPQTTKILQAEKRIFFNLIKEMSAEYYIKAINVLLELLMQQQLTENDSEETIIEIYEILSTLEQFFTSLTPKQVDQMTPVFEECNFIQHLIDYCNKLTFDYNNILYKRMFNRILKIFNVILVNDEQLRIHKTFYKYFQQNMLSNRFFKILSYAILQVSERVESERFFDQVNNALNSLYLCVEDQKIMLDKQGLRFVTQLCSYNPFTTFLRFQPLYPSIDFLEKIYNSLTYIMYQQEDKVKINVLVVDTAQEILRCISAMLTGGNKMNQNYIIDNKFPQILNEVLKLQKLKSTISQGEINQRNRLLQQVIDFYRDNGIEIGPLLIKRIKLMDFRHIYVLNRMKQALLRTLTECVTGNERAFSKIKIQIPIQFLKINMIWIYEDFINSKQQFKQSIILRRKQKWQDVVEQQQPNSLFLMIGFYFYMLIENYNIMEKQKQDDDDDMADDKEKNKQKVVKKFFSSISEKEKTDQQMKSLQKEPFAEQMKQFYQKYYQSLGFFGKHSLTIEVNLLGSLARVYFPKIPLCQKLTQPMIEKFKIQADRVSQDEKIKSLLQYADDIYEHLQGQEQFFSYYQKNYPYLGLVLKSMKYESQFLFIAWVLALVQTLIFLIENYYDPSFDFSYDMLSIPNGLGRTIMFIITIFDIYLAVVLLIYIFARKVPVSIAYWQRRFEQEDIKSGINSFQWYYVLSHTFSQVSYILFVIFCLIATFIHPMFAGFLLTEILNRIQIGKQIIRSMRQTWVQLLVAVALLIIINLLYSMLIYVVFYDPYQPTCQHFFQCLLFLVDSSLKSGSGFLGQAGVDLYPDATTGTSHINMQFLCEVLYVVFAQLVIFQIFSGTIIDKFSQLRQQTQQIKQDQQSFCYVCGQQRFDIDFELQGFQKHTTINHNKINYIFYLFYLKRLCRQNYGIVEKYIEQCQMKKKKQWIPDGTSIYKEEKQRAEKKQDEQDDTQKIHERYYTKKSQQLKKIKEGMINIVQELKGEEQS